MDDFLALCRAFGPLDELVQAGGGNISVKLNDTNMIIKSSGTHLGEVSRTNGHVLVNHKDVCESLQSKREQDITTFVVYGNERPSMETYFHAFLRKYVVHLHPTLMNRFLCSQEPGMVPYFKPGFELSQYIFQTYNNERVMYLRNHGVIFNTDSLEEMYELVDKTYRSYFRNGFVDLRTFWKLQAEFPDKYIFKLPAAETREYIPILKRYNIRPLTPDIALFLHNSVRVEEDCIFILGTTKQKCLGIAEVLRCYCESICDTSTFLKEAHVAEIMYCPTERYRVSHK